MIDSTHVSITPRSTQDGLIHRAHTHVQSNSMTSQNTRLFHLPRTTKRDLDKSTPHAVSSPSFKQGTRRQQQIRSVTLNRPALRCSGTVNQEHERVRVECVSSSVCSVCVKCLVSVSLFSHTHTYSTHSTIKQGSRGF